MKKFLKISIVFIIAILVLLAIILVIDIDVITNPVDQLIHRFHKKRIYIETAHLQYFAFALIAILSLVVYKFDALYTFFQKLLSHLGQAIRNVWKDSKNRNLLIILIVPFLFSIYCAFTVAVSIDEALTYISYIKPWPIYRGLVYYPEPNNHVFYTFLVYIFHQLPFGSDLIKMRIIPVIVSLITWCVAFSFVKKYYSEKVSLFVVAVTSILFMSIYYSFLARGYSLIVLFFVIGLYATFNIIKEGSKAKDWILFTLSGILGAYTIPSFLYPFFTLNLIILIFNYKNIKQQIVYNLVAGITILLLYTPIILVEGIGALSNNPFVKPMDRIWIIQHLLPFFKDALENIFGIPLIPVLILLVAALFFAVRNKNKFTLSLWAIFCITPFVILTIHSVIPFTRTFVYYGFILIFLIGISSAEYINKIPKLWLLVGLVGIQLTSVIYFNATIAEYESFNTYYHDVNKRIVKEDGKTYYMVTTLGRISHQYELEINNFDGSKNKYMTEYPASADTITNYDYVIIDVSMDSTKLKKPFYENKFQRVYINDRE